MKMRYDIRKIHTGFFVQALNLTNQSYSDLLGARMPGRWLSGGFQIAL
jgi:iron complex outermembrane receptor protein